MILLTEQLTKLMAWGLTCLHFLTAISLPEQQARPREPQWKMWDGAGKQASVLSLYSKVLVAGVCRDDCVTQHEEMIPCQPAGSSCLQSGPAAQS